MKLLLFQLLLLLLLLFRLNTIAKKSQIIQCQQLSNEMSRTMEELISVLKQKMTTEQEMHSGICNKHINSKLDVFIIVYLGL